jgi:hypothetical protein
MASSWGGTAIPAPTGYERQALHVGAQFTVADGNMVTDTIASKNLVNLEFANITDAERTTLVGKFTTFASTALIIESETSENVIPIAGSLRVSRLPGGTRAYTVSGQVRTV